MTRVVTFYSYKGGVGRTMALVNAAHALAHQGLRVLMVDLDLEAPGMTHFFAKHVSAQAGKTSKDALDLLLAVKRICLSTHGDEAFPKPVSLEDYVTRIPIEQRIKERFQSPYLHGRLDLLPAPLDSSSSRGYLERLAELDLPGIFGPNGPGHRFGNGVRLYLENVRFEAEGDAPFTLRPAVQAAYDLVLIDSRTGLNESSGLCIGPLCDALVICTGLNEQNVAGTAYFLEQAGLFDQEKSKKYAVVVGPIPPWTRPETASRLERIGRAFHVAQAVVQVPYHPAAALGEPVFVTSDPGEPISAAYEDLARRIMDLTDISAVKFPEIRHASPESWDKYQKDFAQILPKIRLANGHTRGAKSPRPFPTAVALDALGTNRGHSAGQVAVAVAVAAAYLNSRTPFERMIETNSSGREEDLSGHLLFMRLRLLAKLPIGPSERWVKKLLEREPHSEAHAFAMAYANGLGIDVGGGQKKRLTARELAYSIEPPLFNLLGGLEGNFLEGFFRGELPEDVRNRILANRSFGEEYFDELRSTRNLDFNYRARHLPLGLSTIPLMVGILALARGIEAVDEILRWLEQCRLVYGYAWRVLVDPRHLAIVAEHPRFVAFVEEEDLRVNAIEKAIDSGEYAL